MDLDSAILWYASRGSKTHDALKKMGVYRKLLNGAAREAWDFIDEYREEHGEVPPPGIIEDEFEVPVHAPVEDEEDGVLTAHTYVVNALFERHQYRSLSYGILRAHEALNEGEQEESVEEILKLADHLRSAQTSQLQIHSLADIADDVLAFYDQIKSGVTGVPFPWEIMTKMTLGMWPGTLTFFVARPGVGKCLEKSSIIVNPITGQRRTIEEVCESEDRDQVFTWSKDSGVHAVPITAKIDTGHKDCLRIKTKTGRSIVVTPEHPFLLPSGWTRAHEVVVGDTVALPSRIPMPTEPRRVSFAEVDIMAIMLADGACTKNGVVFTKQDRSIVGVAEAAARSMNMEIHSVDNGRDWSFCTKDRTTNPVEQMLVRNGMRGVLSKDKRVPDFVFRLPKDQLCRFLQVFWMCDGYVDASPGITLASKRLVEDIQHLLLRLGVQSTTSYKSAKCQTGRFDAWRLRVHAECFEAFAENIRLWGKKGARLDGLLKKDRNANVGFPRLRQEKIEEIKALSKTGSGRWRGGLHEKVAKELGRSGFCTRDLFGNGGSVKMTAFRAFAMVYGVEDEYRWWWDSDIFWDEVESIEVVGEQKIYDLTVAPTSCFVANDLIVHNTWTAILIAMNAWASGKKVLIVSPELARVELGERMVAKYGKLPYKDMVSGTLPDVGAYPKLKKSVEELKANAKNLFILDNEEKLNPQSIEQAIQLVQPDLVLFDSIYMLRVEQGKVKKGAGSKGDRMERLISTIDWMRVLSRRQWSFAPDGLPIVGIHQLSREGKLRKDAARSLKQGNGTGGLEDAVALSDTLFWNAHNLFAMYQDDHMRRDKNLLYVPLKVRRQAMASSLVIRWDMEAMDFKQLGTKVTDDDDEYEGEDDDVPY